MATEKPKTEPRAEPKHDSTHAELAALKQHTAILTQAVMALMSHLARAGAPQGGAPMQHPGMPPGAPAGAGGAPGGVNPALIQHIIQNNPGLVQHIAQQVAGRHAGAPGMPPQGGPPGMPPQGMPPQGMRPPGMAVGGLQMGMNRLEPMGNFNRGIAHSLTPTHLNFHAPRLRMAYGGMPGMGGGLPPQMMQRPMNGMPMRPPMPMGGAGAPTPQFTAGPAYGGMSSLGWLR
jgi:hypothetical protein